MLTLPEPATSAFFYHPTSTIKQNRQLSLYLALLIHLLLNLLVITSFPRVKCLFPLAGNHSFISRNVSFCYFSHFVLPRLNFLSLVCSWIYRVLLEYLYQVVSGSTDRRSSDKFPLYSGTLCTIWSVENAMRLILIPSFPLSLSLYIYIYIIVIIIIIEWFYIRFIYLMPWNLVCDAWVS